MSICILSDSEGTNFRERGIRPSCRDHQHCSRDEALQLTRAGFCKGKEIDNEDPLARWIHKRAIAWNRAFSWTIVGQARSSSRKPYALTGHGMQAGFPGYQLVTQR